MKARVVISFQNTEHTVEFSQGDIHGMQVSPWPPDAAKDIVQEAFRRVLPEGRFFVLRRWGPKRSLGSGVICEDDGAGDGRRVCAASFVYAREDP